MEEWDWIAGCNVLSDLSSGIYGDLLCVFVLEIWYRQQLGVVTVVFVMICGIWSCFRSSTDNSWGW